MVARSRKERSRTERFQQQFGALHGRTEQNGAGTEENGADPSAKLWNPRRFEETERSRTEHFSIIACVLVENFDKTNKHNSKQTENAK